MESSRLGPEIGIARPTQHCDDARRGRGIFGKREKSMRILELGVRLILWFAVVFLVWLCIYGVASAFGGDHAERVANNGILVVGVLFAVLVYWRSRRTERKL